jgi:hypothetical protein
VLLLRRVAVNSQRKQKKTCNLCSNASHLLRRVAVNSQMHAESRA